MAEKNFDYIVKFEVIIPIAGLDDPHARSLGKHFNLIDTITKRPEVPVRKRVIKVFKDRPPITLEEFE